MATVSAALSGWLDEVLAAIADGDMPRVQRAYARLQRVVDSSVAVDDRILKELHGLALRAAAAGGDEAMERSLARRVHFVELELSRRGR